MTRWFVYIAVCADQSLYTGTAVDVAARLAMHEAGKGARYTRGRGPISLGAKTPCASQSEALRLEIAIKRLSRAEKLRLIQPRRLAAFARNWRISAAPASAARVANRVARRSAATKRTPR